MSSSFSAEGECAGKGDVAFTADNRAILLVNSVLASAICSVPEALGEAMELNPNIADTPVPIQSTTGLGLHILQRDLRLPCSHVDVPSRSAQLNAFYHVGTYQFHHSDDIDSALYHAHKFVNHHNLYMLLFDAYVHI